MAGPSTAKPSVGSVSWIANERSTVQQLGDQDMEDFAFAARNDLEWLNEHMAEIFERNNLDVAELLKTPGKLRGQKTPRTGRKQVRPAAPGRELLANILGFQQPANENPSDNPFYTAAPLPGKIQTSPARGSSRSPSRPLRVLQDTKAKKPTNPIKDNSFGLKQPESQPSLTDSGVWSDFQSQPQQTGFVSEYNSFASEPAIDSRTGDRSSNYHIAPEEPDEREQEHKEQEQEDEEPEEEEVEVELGKPGDNDLEPPMPESPGYTIKVASPGIIALEKPVSSERFAVKSVSLPKEADNKNEPEPRGSGRLARRSSPTPATVEAQPDRPNSSLPPSSPPSLPQQETLVEISEKMPTLPTEQSPIPPLAAVEPIRPQTLSLENSAEPEKNSPAAPQTPGDEDSSRSSSSSESPAPEIPMARKSILNFASLPAREPLTNKKKSLGVKHTRDSNVEQVRLNGTSRASWMNRKGNGKSLGASSRQIERMEKADKETKEVGMKDAKEEEEEEEEIFLKTDASNSLKRKTETVRDGSRKKSKGTSEESELESDESNGETAKAVALHNKTSTQRLHDKIQQLGKVNASREARPFPSSGSSVAYPELPQLENDTVQAVPASKSTESEKGQPSVTTIGQTSIAQDDEEWIPMPKQTLTRSQSQKEEIAAKEQTLARSQSHTEGTVASKQQETEKPVSARWRHHSPQHTSPQPTSIRTITTSESAPNLRSPAAVRQLPLSPLKASFSEDWIKTPASPAAKSSGEGAITAVKAHTSVVFKKAKEMLLKSSTASTSAKIETMNPASRGWHGGQNSREQNSREQPKNIGSQKSAKSMEQLYPDLGAMMADLGAETRQMSIDVPEAVLEPNREPRRTRSSASKDTHENSPEVEQSAVKIQKARAERESERLEREQQFREKEEQLRRVEEELLREREERELERRQQEEKLRKQREESLRLAEEKLRQERELQQKYKEERIRREKEEFKKFQEEKLKQEKEELKRRQQEELRKQKEEAQKAKEAPASFHEQDDSTDKEEDEDNQDDDASEADTRTMIRSSAESERPPSRLQRAGGIRFQKTRDTKPVQRPGSAMKDHAKPKGPPVSISVGTASQREMQNQRNKPPGPSTLVAALKQSFENPSLMTSTSQTSLNSSTSNNSLKSSNLGGPPKPPKSLAAAASQLKKEQEDKERKLVVKREIERRKLENQRKMDDEAARRARQKPASTQKTLARTPAVANLRQTSEEPERRLDFKTGAKLGIAKTAVKRAFQPDAAEEQQQYRQTATKPGAPSYQQDTTKKRRTGEYDERGERTYEMAPPIRQSVAKKLIRRKEIVPKSAIPHGYTQASASGMQSMLRPPNKHGVPMPQVESVKFSKEKIRFAGESSVASASTTPSTFKTPGSKSAKPSKTPAGAKDSPIYPNGELIDLPDIQTDSDDDDDDYPAKSDFHVPKWAESPELRGLLENQQSINPEDVFGPMARLDMDAIFRDGGGRQKFRARTSSANWSGADRLTPDEIAADMEARRKMIEQGGWKYQPPQ
ncbi:hypothetical protein DFP73DRAFT_572921 [Morchella snyderi]|nr:hypothetical protein DFP73DRAFT_572921 [Morchella snyderi]